MFKLEEKALKCIFTDLGRTKFNLTNHWHCSHISRVGTKMEYTMQKINRRGNWGQNTIIGYVDIEKIEGDIHEAQEDISYA